MRTNSREGKAPSRRSTATETARSADRHSSEHPLLRLQRQIGNHAVGRLLHQPGGLTVIQRLSFFNTRWQDATRARRSGAGQTGVLFVEDNTPETLVVKGGGKDPAAELQVAHAVYQKLGQGKLKVPPIRLATHEDREGINRVIDEKLVATEQQMQAYNGDFNAFKNDIKQKFSGLTIFIMGKASGETFKETAEGRPQQARQLLLNADYVRRLGMAAAIDLFLGNSDRLFALNTGNWMTDTEVDNEITLIDNFDAYGQQNFTEQSQRDWERGYLKNLLPSGWEEFAKNVLTDMKRQHGIRFTPEEQQIFKENFKHGMKDGYNRILSKFAPTIGRRSRTLKKQIRQIRGKDKATKEIMHLYNPESMDPWEFLKKRASLLRWGR